MAGIINKLARQLDLRGRDASGIVHVVLNPGFNIVDDATLKVLMENKHNQVLVDEGALIVGAKKRREDVEAEQEQAARDAATSTMPTPAAAAAAVRTDVVSKDPNVNAETGEPVTKAEQKAAEKAAADSKLDI
jgi:septal ring-binding cell division protein DamX